MKRTPILQRIENLRVLARTLNIELSELKVTDKDYKELAGKLSQKPIQLRYIFNDTVFTVIVVRKNKGLQIARKNS